MSDLDVILDEALKGYLISCGDDGGHSSGYCHHLHKLYLAKPKSFAKEVAALLNRVGKAKWHSDTRISGRSDDQQLEMFGEPVQRIFTFPDPTVPGGHRKILAEHARFHHAREDAILTMRIGAQTSAKAEEKMRWYEKAVRRAGGDPLARIVDHADLRPETVPAEPDQVPEPAE